MKTRPAMFTVDARPERTVASHAATDVFCWVLKSLAFRRATSPATLPSVSLENPFGPRKATSYTPADGAW
ncbi:MAG: hypothetical protein E6I72_12715 [Chloroflexi bacterium]|nr:MAG: hypothetical protein E6I72_12715 [Chloroflexota bacterium]